VSDETPTPENPTDTEPTPTEKTFTQEELNNKIAERVARLNSKIAQTERELSEARAAQTPKEKVNNSEEIGALKAALAAQQTAFTNNLIENAVKDAALTAGVPLQKVPLVARLIDRSSLVDEAGGVDLSKVQAEVEDVLNIAPEWKSAGVPTGSGQPVGAGPGASNAPTPEPESLAEAIDLWYAQQRFGR